MSAEELHDLANVNSVPIEPAIEIISIFISMCHDPKSKSKANRRHYFIKI